MSFNFSFPINFIGSGSSTGGGGTGGSGGSAGGSGSGSGSGSGNYGYQQPAVQYYNTPMSGGAGMFFSPFGGPMYYNAPILPVDEGTLQDYIRKQM